MNRDIYHNLVEWKSSPQRKPLMLRGARQTGKTYILKEFGRCEYENVFYCNFEEDPTLEGLFAGKLTPARILELLGIYHNSQLRPGRDLIIFDEVQACNAALNCLKYFCESANEYHIAAAGSLLGVKLSSPKSFPVGKVTFLDLHPMTFLEFLEATGSQQYRLLLEGITELVPLASTFHVEMVDLLRTYYCVGGMPEAVECFARPRDLRQVRGIQEDILNAYVLDFAKHAPSADIPKLSLIWDSVPTQLARENKKFLYSAVRKGARAKGYENALKWLEDAGLLLRCHAVSTSRHPLKGYMDRDCFKIYSLDVGLLGAMAGVPLEVLVRGDELFYEYGGAFVESYVAQQLAALGMDLYYWRSPGKIAELDFLCQIAGAICPLEVKAGVNPRSKSLRSYDNQFNPSVLGRATLLNLKHDGKICNIPLYAISLVRELLGLAMSAQD
ncbi:MAG: ATP-binding protein [Planctomycetes bacterium]|nr:ATP-binding protein [Planctomycetota bacterium]